MGTNYRFRKDHFFLKVEQIIPSSGRLIFLKNVLILGEEIFRLIEIFVRNCLLLCVTSVTVSCSKKLLKAKPYSS